MHVRARRSMSERRGDCGFWREALKRKLILGAARAAGRERPLSCAAAATFHRRISRDAAFAASSLLHCARAPGRSSLSDKSRQKPQEMVPDQAACDAMRRSFASAAPFMV
ncbi:MAG: hypothetical protein PPHEMADM_2504 [uncultured Paraburkholderia sp.]|nr:MAG: hypothetical protein PPHEMADE_2458 [uncultured Paraburkholderia sp.]CAH2923469.1 MAG: hypothetical protein PPHEMADM_2504 [uncultured Paraburkholderia sp.]